ncbi:NAD(P)-binding domain-containing protein [Acetobacter estunensis]|nr:NAD(P)-binding domain-containing protein [Acetobacter estunensis]
MMITDTVIIGAGPYGLSLAAHLHKKGADFRIFGRPMAFWRDHVPCELPLKAEGFALDLFDPARTSTLNRFCAEHGYSYAPIGVPIKAKVFADYGEYFQRQHVPELELMQVTHLVRTRTGFNVALENGDTVRTTNVVIAVGIGPFAQRPQPLQALPSERVHHTFDLLSYEHFSGKKVAVIGGGSSAVDAAYFLHKAGAKAALFTRQPKIWINNPPRSLSGLQRVITRIKKPRSGLGTGWRSRLACDFPDVFHLLPSHLRLRITHGHLGPAAGWVTGATVREHVPIHLNLMLKDATLDNGKIRLQFENSTTEERQLIEVDHVIAGTGARIDLSRLPFLDHDLLPDIETEDGMPVLSRYFESTVPGLHFIGPTAAASFGPLLRFAWGARFTARRLTARSSPLLPLSSTTHSPRPFSKRYPLTAS